MKRFRLERAQWVPLPAEPCFDFFSEARNLALITPGWLGFRLIGQEPPELRAGTRIEYRIRWLVFPLRWLTLIRRFEPPRWFVDQQIRGPYRLWVHAHEFEEDAGGTWIRDQVDYALPLGPIGIFVHGAVVRRQLEAIFDYRARRIRELLGGQPPAEKLPVY